MSTHKTGAPDLRAPFPWFGGKRRVAQRVWAALGGVDNYVEPFAGSLAVLLDRPDDRWQTGAETVNDADAYLCNFWRALQAAPDEVAKYADWPVDETDLLSRHIWLVNEGAKRIASLEADPEFYDAKVAGWWVWGLCAWIGRDWCKGNGPWKVVDGAVVQTGDGGAGVNKTRPHLSCGGQGINRKPLHRGDDIRGYFEGLAARLRRVRVCAGDWSRVVTDGALSYGSHVGIFLDPPYSGELRDHRLYRVDDHSINRVVREWALAHGNNPRYRIVLAGYEEEHAVYMPNSWRVHAYSAGSCYQTMSANNANRANRHKERLWFSPFTYRQATRRCMLPAPVTFEEKDLRDGGSQTA